MLDGNEFTADPAAIAKIFAFGGWNLLKFSLKQMAEFGEGHVGKIVPMVIAYGVIYFYWPADLTDKPTCLSTRPLFHVKTEHWTKFVTFQTFYF